jgi:excisionase family DNA binding protein
MTPESPLLDADAAAAYLSVSKGYLYKLTSQRRLGFVKYGQSLRFRRKDLDAFIEEHRIAPVRAS